MADAFQMWQTGAATGDALIYQEVLALFTLHPQASPLWHASIDHRGSCTRSESLTPLTGHLHVTAIPDN